MKALFTAAVAGLAGVTAMIPAQASTFSVGNSSARDCWEAAEAQDYDRNAIYHCNLALENEGLDDANRAATLVNRGILYMRNRNYSQAERDFNRAMTTDESNAEAYLNMAISHLRQNENDTSVMPWIEKAIALNTKEQALAYYSRAILHERSGNIRQAYYDYRKAHELAPDWDEPAEDLQRYKVVRK
jgi:tetratricopeptide (TPR) repeat protein